MKRHLAMPHPGSRERHSQRNDFQFRPHPSAYPSLVPENGIHCLPGLCAADPEAEEFGNSILQLCRKADGFLPEAAREVDQPLARVVAAAPQPLCACTPIPIAVRQQKRTAPVLQIRRFRYRLSLRLEPVHSSKAAAWQLPVSLSSLISSFLLP